MSTEAFSVPDRSAGWTSKRYLGIPVVYLVGAVVAILVMVAYLGSKKNTTGSPTNSKTSVPVDPYAGLASNGTVTTAAPTYYVSPNTQNVNTPAVQTESQWETGAVGYLMSQGVSATEAQAAISAYVNGQDMSYAQKQLVDKALAGYGLPGTLGGIGNVTVNYTDPNIYKSYQRVASTGSISGILQDGTIHHFTPEEWIQIVNSGDYARKPYVSL